jgi:Cupin-like domain
VTGPVPIAEWSGVDRVAFERDIAPRYEPAVLRGLVSEWPAVRRGAESDAALASFLCEMDSGGEVDALLVPPEHRGRIFYGDGRYGFNFLRNRLPISKVIEQTLRYARHAEAPAVAVQSALAADCVPSFANAHPMPLIDAAVAPRIWIGNAIVTPAHFDEASNIACVAAGARRFTLFPPEQIGNLYIGPIGHAPTPTPISLVDFDRPDLARFPRFEAALRAARVAVLRPGDAVYIPPLWWHHVASLEAFNVLVNYWWRAEAIPMGLDALLHARLAFSALPAAQRRAWQALFAHWVFDDNASAVAHLAPAWRGVHGELTPELRAQIRALLRARLAD